MKDNFHNHKPTEDIIICFDDKTGSKRTQEEIDTMFREFIEVANKYDFDINMWGNSKSMYKALKLRYETKI